MELEFTPFNKIARLRRNCVITEKIDGTNAQVCIVDSLGPIENAVAARYPGNGAPGQYMLAGSRSRYVVPSDDNYGWAAWVQKNAEDLWSLGVGHHYGEWWGAGIQRRYAMTEKRFSLFNVNRWSIDRPGCCSVVPVLYRGLFTSDAVQNAVNVLQNFGSMAAPGFMKPEGVVCYMDATRTMFKQTLEKDDAPKGQAA